ncbi:tail completion protein gp17 [Halalkalibacter oceani]|uniref:tail completion protein gp17 n=1 Tax=Halalkalibacter oceani TaxID=1653776 RepID=UPI003395FCA3
MNQLVLSILEPLGVPVAFQTYTGDKTTYITFFEYNQQGALSADDEEIKTVHSLQVDVWSQGNYVQLVKDVKNAMKQAGFIRAFETEFYEDDTDYYHKVIRFNYVSDTE